jgi:hypothetical protein
MLRFALDHVRSSISEAHSDDHAVSKVERDAFTKEATCAERPSPRVEPLRLTRRGGSACRPLWTLPAADGNISCAEAR